MKYGYSSNGNGMTVDDKGHTENFFTVNGQTYVYDENGNYKGTAFDMGDGSSAFYSSDGRLAGNAFRQPGGSTAIFGTDGSAGFADDSGFMINDDSSD